MFSTDDDLDKLNYLAGKEMDFVNKMAMQGTILAHNDGGVPNLMISIPEMNAYWFGYMVYFFEKACGISGYLLGVNPFDQPGLRLTKRICLHFLVSPDMKRRKLNLNSVCKLV